jgi:hypothetical protein
MFLTRGSPNSTRTAGSKLPATQAAFDGSRVEKDATLAATKLSKNKRRKTHERETATQSLTPAWRRQPVMD